MQTYAIGELARHTGVKPETIRYFEKIGLLSAAPRAHNGYRRYESTHLRQLQFIQQCRKLDFPQKEISDLVNVFLRTDHHTRAEVKQITSCHLNKIRQKIVELQALEQALSSLIQRCEGDLRSATECPILASLSKVS